MSLVRVARRPDPAEWGDDELLNLREAVALFWPDGPITVSALRSAIRRGDLAHVRIAGKLFTSRGAVEALAVPTKAVRPPVAAPAPPAAATPRRDPLANFFAVLDRCADRAPRRSAGDRT